MDIRREFLILNLYTLKPLNFRLYSRRQAGYTLLELLVSVGIMIIIAAATIPGLGANKTVNELNDVALDFQSKLKQAQSYALSPPTDNQGATAYGVRMTDENGKISYAIVRLMGINAELYPSGTKELSSLPVTVKSVSPSGIKIIWYKIGTTIKIETEPVSSGDISFTFGLRNGNPNEIRTVTVDSLTGAINAQ